MARTTAARTTAASRSRAAFHHFPVDFKAASSLSKFHPNRRFVRPMAKKVKIPRKAVTVARGAAPADFIADAPDFKAGGKGKPRRLAGDPAAAGTRRPKRDSKAKTKAGRSSLSSAPKRLVKGLADMLRAPEAGVSAKAAALRKAAAQRPARLGRLERLEAAVDEVRLGGRLSPRTRKLQLSGTPKMAQKVIEEAGEVAVEALLGNTAGLVNESVDLLYNLIVLLSGLGVTVEMLWAEMDRRELTLGMAEKLPKAPDPDG